MILRRCASLAEILFVAILAVGTSGCSGGGQGVTPPVQAATSASPAISVSLPESTATVEEGTILQFAAMVKNDAANKGVTWTVACSATACGSVSPTSTASGALTTFTPPGSPASNLTVTLTAASVADVTKSASVTVTVPALTVSLMATGVTVVAGNTAQFTATVSNDGANKGVTWAVSCSAAQCGSVSPTSTASGVATIYTAPAAPPTSGLTVTVMASSVTDGTKAASAAVTIPAIGPSVATVSGTIKVGTAPSAIAVDSGNNKIVVTDFGGPEKAFGTHFPCLPTGADVTVIDGATETMTVSSFFPPENPSAVVIDPTSHVAYVVGKAYVASLVGCEYSPPALSGVTDANPPGLIGQLLYEGVFVSNPAGAVAVNPVTGKIYVTGLTSVLVLNGATRVTVPVGTGASGLAVNTTSNKIYVANQTSNNISLIDGATNSVITVADPAANPSRVAINPVTNKVYVSHSSSNTISVIDGATNAVSTVADPNAINPGQMVVNTTTGKVYVANGGSDNVTVIDGFTNAVTTIPAGTSPVSTAVDPQTNFIYVANQGNSQAGDPGNVTVINGATNAATTLSDSNAKNPVAIAVNPLTNKIYVANSGSNNVTVIDGAHN